MDGISNILHSILLLLLPLQCWEPSLTFKLNAIKFHFIVVGGGSGGSVVASRLSENPGVNVLLLEAGGCPTILNEIPAAAPILRGTDSDWQFKVEPQINSFFSYINRQPKYAQGKVLGGGSNINDMMYVRGNSWDYDNWAAMGNQGWGYEDVLPYFLKAEGTRVPQLANDATYHNTNGPLTSSTAPYNTPSLEAFLKSGVENGYSITDINGKQQTGVAPNVFTMRNGARCSTEKAYLQPARSRPNLFIATNCFVTKIIFSSQKKAIGVEFVNNNMKYIVNASKEVILSAGTLGSPKILKLSGVGPAAELHKFNIPVVVDLPGVGQNLQDHVGCGALIWTVDCLSCTYNTGDAMSLKSIANWGIFRDGPLTVSYGNEGVAFVKTRLTNTSVTPPDIQMLFVTADLIRQLRILASQIGASIEDLNRYYGPISNKQTFSFYVFNLQPKSRGSLDLQSNDPMKPPILNLQYLRNPEDMRRLVEGVKIALKLGNSQAFASLGARLNPTVYPGCEAVQQFSDAYWECACRHFTVAPFHPAGTCKMGVASDQMAVVDSNLKVYKVGGLRVIDASIMPQVTSGNLNAPVIMIAEKVSDSIKKEHGLI